MRMPHEDTLSRYLLHIPKAVCDAYEKCGIAHGYTKTPGLPGSAAAYPGAPLAIDSAGCSPALAAGVTRARRVTPPVRSTVVGAAAALADVRLPTASAERAIRVYQRVQQMAVGGRVWRAERRLLVAQ
jgi:hypothetical protein